MKEFQNEPINASMAAHPVHWKESNDVVFSVSLSRLAPNDLLSPMTVPAPDTDYETWRAEMQAVQVELDRIKALNAPTVALNRQTLSKVPLPFQPEAWIRPFQLREEKHSAILTRKPPATWKKDVDAIEDKSLRAAVGSIVWWDFFGHRPVLQRWPHLDKYLNCAYVEIAKEELKRGLALVGYSPWHAHRRLSASLDYAPDKMDKAGQPRRHCKVNNIFHNVAKK